jgi:putative ABC transport system permease protein
MLKDLRFGLRMLLKQPGFSGVAVLTLALGIGATAAVFSLIEGVLLTPPPYRDPSRLVLIPAARTDGKPTNAPEWSAAQWTEWQRQVKSVDSIAGNGWTFSFIVRHAASRSKACEVTRDYFRVLGLQPMLGRIFSEAEATPNGPPVIVLGYDVWKQKFNGDPNIVGKTIRMSRRDVPPTVVGVMPPGVRFLQAPGASQKPNYNLNAMVDYWVPAAVNPQGLKNRFWNVVARLKDGSTVAQSQTELSAITGRVAQSDRDLDGYTPQLTLLTAELNRDGRGILLPLLGAAALVLLIACGSVAALLLIRAMMNLAQVQSGFRTTHILTATVTAVQGDWLAFHRQALDRVSGVAGVQKAAFAWGVPLTGNDWPGAIEFEGQPPAAKASDRVQLPLRAVTPGYFELLGQTVTDGRDFRPTDTQGAPLVAIVNHTLVDRYFPHTNAIGKKIWGRGRERPANEIIGVVSNGRTGDLSKPPEPEVYLCLWQQRAFSKHLVVRTAADPRGIMAAIQRELRAVDPTVAVENVKTMDEIRGESLASRTFAMQLLIGYAAVGSVLTLVGIYGVLALSVASRRREIAIRAAVGAEQHHIRKLVFAEGARLIAGGVVLGAGAAVVMSSLLQTFLFGVGAADPNTFAGVCVLFGVVALAACWGPIRRASQVDPIEALRYE